MQSVIKALHIGRGYMQSKVGDLSQEQLLEVPDGASNNVLWNVGHTIHSHDSMLYKSSGADLPTPDAWADLFKAGTSPKDWSGTPPIDEVMEAFASQVGRIAEDAQKGVFNDFKPMELMPGATLENPEETIGFMLVHEGAHIGVILAIRRLLGVTG